MLNKKERMLSGVIFIYFICFVFRFIEYFLLRTDQTFWGEAFVHKLIGILILFIAARYYNLNFSNIGFSKNKIWNGCLKGLAFGLLVFIPAYSAEIILTIMQGRFTGLSLYVSSYSVNGVIGNQTEVLFFVICITGNIINVIMEEGIFRGLFQNMLEQKYSFIVSAVIGSCLFGLWHIIAPIRGYYDGTMGYNSLIANIILLVVTSGLMGFQLALMTKLTNNLYMAMAHHFVNNTIVNILHVVSSTGADELMVVRIAIAQSISFVTILLWYTFAQRKQNKINSTI